MLIQKNPTKTEGWQKLKDHFDQIKNEEIKDYFNSDKDRFNNFSISFDELFLDYSKNRITKKTLELLLAFANEMQLKQGINSLFSGAKINQTEKRAGLHTALRQQTDEPLILNGENIISKVKSALGKMKDFCEKVHSGQFLGYTGNKIRHIINIGIGGSDLGPVMVTEALKPYWLDDIKVDFVSNVDATHIVEALKNANPEEILFVIASKTFTTQETMTNAVTAKEWFLRSGANEEHIKNHFIALSTNVAAAVDFGIDENNIFKFWNWVGGRYSLSSSIGMSIALAIGFENFDNLLKGLNAMDEHFKKEPFHNNIPVILALIGIWYNNFFESATEAILPYNQYLHRFAAYFQQGNMESNGKSVDRNGEKIDYQTGPVIWGEPGTNGQHAFYQLIHQGTKLIPCDFIAAAISQNPTSDHQEKLLSNFFAQTEALMNGKTKDEVIHEFEEKGEKEFDFVAPYKVFEGNRPTNSILIKKLTPYNLGKLISMYEHKIFVQGYLWNIFSFDQWGVELGKQLAKKILPELMNDEKVDSHDTSTNGLINKYKKMRK